MCSGKRVTSVVIPSTQPGRALGTSVTGPPQALPSAPPQAAVCCCTSHSFLSFPSPCGVPTCRSGRSLHTLVTPPAGRPELWCQQLLLSFPGWNVASAPQAGARPLHHVALHHVAPPGSPPSAASPLHTGAQQGPAPPARPVTVPLSCAVALPALLCPPRPRSPCRLAPVGPSAAPSCSVRRDCSSAATLRC